MKKKQTRLSLQAIPLFQFIPENRSKGAPSTDPTLTTITLTTGTEPAFPLGGRRPGQLTKDSARFDRQLA